MKLNRRDLIRLGAGATLVGVTGPWNTLLASEGLATTTVPSSGAVLPSIGLGTNRYRGKVGTADMAPLKQTLEALTLEQGDWRQLGTWRGEQTVAVPPFDAIQLALRDLWA